MWRQDPEELTTVDSYIITVATTPNGCTADVANVTSTLDGSQRTFLRDTLEEFSEITISFRALNRIGESSTSVTAQTPRAGKSITHQQNMAVGIQ